MSRKSFSSIFAVLFVCAALIGAYFLAQPRPNPAPSNIPAQNGPNTDVSDESGGLKEATSYDVKVFFSKPPESDDDPSKVFPVIRTTQSQGVATFAITELIKGPNSAEKAQKFESNVVVKGESNCSGKDFQLRISEGTARLQFCRQFELIGTIYDAKAQSQLTATLKQFSTVKKVVILSKDGDCLFDLSGDNRCLKE